MRDFLRSRPSFLSGAARVLDLGGAFDSGEARGASLSAGARAIDDAWRVVGEALWGSLDRDLAGRGLTLESLHRPGPRVGCRKGDEPSSSALWPSPDVLVRYEEIVPGCAERLLAMVEKQVEHHQAVEKRTLAGNLALARVGQILAFVLAAGVSVEGFYLVMIGRDASGIAAIVAALAGLMGVFVHGRRAQQRERSRTREGTA